MDFLSPPENAFSAALFSRVISARSGLLRKREQNVIAGKGNRQEPPEGGSDIRGPTSYSREFTSRHLGFQGVSETDNDRIFGKGVDCRNGIPEIENLRVAVVRVVHLFQRGIGIKH